MAAALSAMSCRALSLLLLLPLAFSARGADGAGSADAVGAGEFPGLQLLPAGSVVENISLPRYENHRVTALLQAEQLCIIDRRTVELRGIRGTLYNSDGTKTEVQAGNVRYDFTTKKATSSGTVSVTDPRFSARGERLLYNTNNNRGVLVGPVRTTFSTKALMKKKGGAAASPAATPADK